MSQEARFGWEEDRLTRAADWRRSYEPLFVLRRNGTETDPLWTGGDAVWKDKEEDEQPLSVHEEL